jgi:hypothetical protein
MEAEPTGDFVLDHLAVSGKVVHPNDGSSGFDTLDNQIKLGFGPRGVLLGNLYR